MQTLILIALGTIFHCAVSMEKTTWDCMAKHQQEEDERKYFIYTYADEDQHLANVKFIQQKIATQTNINERLTGFSHAPLFEAVRMDQVALVKELLQNGADYLARTNSLLTVFHAAVCANAVDSAREIVDYCKKLQIPLTELINAQSYKGQTALHYACTTLALGDSPHYCTLMQLLLEHGADFNKVDQWGQPPFFALKERLSMYNIDQAMKKKKKILELCHQFNADFSLKDNSGHTLFEHMQERFAKLEQGSKVASPGMVIYAHIYKFKDDPTNYFVVLPKDVMHLFGDIICKGYRPNY